MARFIGTRILPIFLTVAVATVSVVLLVWLMGVRLSLANEALLDARRTQIELGGLVASLAEVERGQRGFLLTEDQRYLAAYTRGIQSIHTQLNQLDKAGAEGLVEQRTVVAIRELSEQYLARLEQTLGVFGSQGREAAIAEVRTGAGMMMTQELRQLVSSVEAQQAAQEAAMQRRIQHATVIRTASVVVGALLMLAFIAWAYRRLARDIQQREQSEAEVAAGRHRLGGIVGSAMDAIISVDEEQKIVLFNKAAERVFRCSADEVMGAPLDRFIPARFREVHRAHVRRFGETGQTSRAMGSASMPLSGIRADGEEFPIDASISQIQVGGQRIFTVILRDITDRKRADEELAQSRKRLEGIVASAMDAIISIDEEQKIVLFNTAAEKVFMCPASEALGAGLDRFLPERYRTIHRKHVQHFGETGQTTRAMGGAHMNLVGLRTSGEEFPIDASISQVEVGGHKLFTVILRDITERKKAEAELMRFHADLERRVQERTADLAAANRELEAFGYSVSHDLRAPLRHVTGFVELLQKHAGPSLDEKAQHYVKTIHEASRRMGNLIDDLLMLSRIGRATLNQTEVDLRELVDETITQLAGETAGRRVDWKIGHLPKVMADATLLRNVMMNLLSNAIKYSRTRDPANIEIASHQENNELVCFVRDNGVGFDMQFVDKLFGVFQRLHRPEEFEGTGIGLASVRRIIQRHGGRTWAEGEVNQGATIYFSLPRTGAVTK